MLKVVSAQFDGDRGIVIIESDKEAAAAIAELQSLAAKELALKEARKAGLVGVGHGIIHHPYPVDVNGQVVTDPMTSLAAAYRIDIPVMSATP